MRSCWERRRAGLCRSDERAAYEASRRRSQELEGLYKISRAFDLTDTSEIYGR